MSAPLFCDRSQWIWLGGMPAENCYLQFRHGFTPRAAEPVELRLSAEGQFVAYVNGSVLPATQYPDYPHHKAVSTIRLSDCVPERENLLEIQVHYTGADSSVARKEAPGLRFELWQGQTLLAASSPTTAVRPLSGYRCGPIGKITQQLGFGFIWTLSGEDAPWQSAQAAEKACVLVPRPIPELRVDERCPSRLISQGVFTAYTYPMEQYAALAFRERETLCVDNTGADGIALSASEGDGIYLIFDLGKETVGYLELDISCPTPTTIDVGYGEHLEDLRVRTNVGGRQFVLRCQTSAAHPHFSHRFHRLGCRYLQLFLHGREAVVRYAGLRPVRYPFQSAASFSCSDHLHTQIYQVAKYTLDCCLHEHYEDCPWREQALYAFDSRNQMLFGYYAYGEFTQPRASLRTLALSQRPDGLLELCAPARVPVNIPAFSLAFVVELEEYCRYSGDIAFGQELLPVVRRILQTVHGQLSKGLVWNFREPQYWNFYEWRPLLEGTPIERTQPLPPSAEAPLQLYYLLALRRTAAILRYLGREDAPLNAEIQTVQNGLEAFWDPDAQAYASFLRDGRRIQYAELTQALALYAEAVPAPRCAQLREKLASGTLLPISLSSSIFRYEALLQQPERYAAQVFEEIAEKWGSMLYHGATTFWETELGAEDFERAGSLCHAWSSVPLYLYGAYLLGVRPDEPGIWKQHAPAPAPIYCAEGSFPTPHGRLDAKAVHAFAD